MRIVLALVVVVGMVACAGASLAADTGHRQPAKPAAMVAPNVPDPARQGGDTIADATLIPAIPYYDAGTTTGFNDDYDEVCPYSGSTSPDVVYAYTPAGDLVLTIDMDGSAYDTKIYVYDEELNLVACNDDYYPDYVSKLESVPFDGDVTYFIVIDGYGGEHGDYVMNVVESVPCVLECPPGGTLEGEPPLEDGYLDAYNGGCNSPEFGLPFQDLYGDADGNLVFCGVSGWYLNNGSNYRDTDWFHVYMGPGGTIELSGDAARPTYIFEQAPQDCGIPEYAQRILIGTCDVQTMTIEWPDPGDCAWVIAAPTTFEPPHPDFGHEYDYVLWFSGLAPQPVATETATWTSVKSLFE
jgi:hypothetical protein